MKKCPVCGEMVMDTTKICPVCGYEFPTLDIEEKDNLERNGVEIPVKNGGTIFLYEELFVDKYPPFLEGTVPAVKLAIKNNSDKIVTLEISAGIEKYAYENKATVVLNPKEDYSYSYYPSLKKEMMGKLKSYGKSILYYKIDGDIKHVIEKRESILILSYGDILWQAGNISLADYIIKWVTPRDDIIRGKLLNKVMDEMKRIKEIKDKFGDNGLIFGEQGGREGIYAQTWALYNALKKWGIRYKSTSVSILQGFQRVRLPKEVLEEKGGNCIDLTVTFAAALEAMELTPVIILIPGHTFPGVVIPPNMARDLRNRGYESIVKSINSRYQNIMKKYGTKISEEYSISHNDDNSSFTLKTLDQYLFSCCGKYLLPVESTMIPDCSFFEAIKNIYESGKIESIKKVIIVPEARKKLGYNVLPYENI